MRVCNQNVKKSEESGGVSLKASYQVLVEIIYEREFDKKEKKTLQEKRLIPVKVLKQDQLVIYKALTEKRLV